MMNWLVKLKNVFVKNVPDNSDAGKVNGTDIAKVAKTGLLVGAAATLSFFITTLAPALGDYQPVVVLGLTVVLDFVNKLIKSNG